MKSKAFKTIMAMVLSLSMVFSLVPMMAVNAETYYSFTQPFTNFQKSEIGTSRTDQLNYFYTNGSYNNYTTATYDIVNDTTERGKVLKMVSAPGETSGRLFYFLGEKIEGNVKIGFKFKVTGDISSCWTNTVMGSSGGTLLGVQNGNYYAGWGSGRTAITSYVKHGEWNTIYYTLGLGTGKANVEINGTTLYDVNLGASGVSASKTNIEYLDFAPRYDVVPAGTTTTTYYDDISIEELSEEPSFEAPELGLVSSSVENGETNVPWVNSIELMFDRDINADTASNITLTQNGAAVAKKVVVDGKRVLVRHANLTSKAQCTLTIPTTVKSVDMASFKQARTITFTPADDFLMNVDFENMNVDLANPSKSDVSLHGRSGYGIDFYANHSFTTSSSTDTLNGKSNVTVVEENGNKVLKFTANQGGGGFFYIHLNQTLTGGLAEISFKFKVPTKPTGAYSMAFFQYNGFSLLAQDGVAYYLGWKGSNRTSVNSLYENTEWNTVKYIIDMDRNKAHVIVNEGTSKEVSYYEPVYYSGSGTATPPAEIQHLRISPSFDGMAAGAGYTAYYDDIVVRRIPSTGLKFESKAVEGTLAANEEVTIKAMFNNGTGLQKSATAIAGLYSADGKLKEVKKAAITLFPAEKDAAIIPMTLPADYVASDYIRVFGIENFSSLKPLGESK